MRRVTLIPALWLMLSAAAAPADLAALRDMAECRSTFAAAQPMLATLEVRHTDDQSVPPARDVTEMFVVPKGLTVFGFPVTVFGATNMIDPGKNERRTVVTNVAGSFAEVEAAVLKANGLETCPRRLPNGAANCLVFMGDGESNATLLIRQKDSEVNIACQYRHELD